VDHDSVFDSQLFGTFACTDVSLPLPWYKSSTNSPSKIDPSAALCIDNQCGANKRNKKKKSNQTRPKNKIVDPKCHHLNATTKEMVAVAPQQRSWLKNTAQMPDRKPPFHTTNIK
jgi:hypothetical protein